MKEAAEIHASMAEEILAKAKATAGEVLAQARAKATCILAAARRRIPSLSDLPIMPWLERR
jgi:ElaB/YqjD/DUF883 family membrane-anchored ribosome-binding protein